MISYHKLSENELMSLLTNGSHEAFLEIYDRYKTPLQQHAYKKLGNAQDVQDIIQELFTELWNKRESILLTTGLTNYLFRSARNRSLNLIYKKRKESNYLASLEEFVSDSNFLIDLQIREQEFAQQIQREIDLLPPRMKEVYKLSREEGLSHKEISEKLGISQTTVATQMTNVLKILRKKLMSIYFFIF